MCEVGGAAADCCWLYAHPMVIEYWAWGIVGRLVGLALVALNFDPLRAVIQGTPVGFW